MIKSEIGRFSSPAVQATEAVYSIENLTKRYRKAKSYPANDNISLDIMAGEFFGLLGSNGAGKSSLIQQMVNLTAPTSGRIRLMGQDIARNPAAVTRYVAYMPQKPTALLDLTTEEAIYFTGHLRGLPRTEAQLQTARLIEEWNLGEIRRRTIRQLSGGQHRLVCLATTLIGNLPVLILDEPTNDLDPAYRRQVWEHLLVINREQGKTIILVTHSVQEAERVLQRVAVMHRGKMVGLGRVSELKAKLEQKVSLELFLKPEFATATVPVLQNLPEAVETRPFQWTVHLPRQNGEETIHQILSAIQLSRLEDFRVHTASLEDVYLQLTGKPVEAEESEETE